MRLFNSVADVYKALEDGVPITQKFGYSHPVKTEGISIRLSLGRIWFNLLMPSDFPLVNEAVDKKKISQILKEIIIKYTPEEASDYTTKLNQEAFKMSSYCPTTFQSDSLILSDEVEDAKEKLKKIDFKSTHEFQDVVNKISDEVVKEVEDSGSRLDNIRVSGGKAIPWDKLMVAQGYLLDIEGQMHGPIKNAVSDGNNPEDFYVAAAEARLGFYYKSAISAKPGYLGRRVTMANANVLLDDSIPDCGTTKYFKLTVDKNIAKIIDKRYIIVRGKPKLIEDPQSLIGETINLRSPLYCKSEKGICPICFGDSWKTMQNKNIGILAGGNVNDFGVNAYMKMRHKSSVPPMVQIDFVKDLEKFNMLTADFKKCFIVEKNKITSNVECFINIDLHDYDDKLLVESVDYYLLPGILQVTLTEDNTKTWTFPFDFPVKLMKPAEIQEHGKLIIYKYTPGELIMQQDVYPYTADVSVLEKLVEGQAQYIQSPEILCHALLKYLDGMDLNMIELIVQNMFRDSINPMKPARLTDYTNFQIIGQKGLPFKTSWINALSFENPKKAIQYGLVSGQNAEDDPITKIVNEKYSSN